VGENSKIEWTHHTFNPWWGCVKVSPACKNCYAETFAKRTGHVVWGVTAPRRFFGEKHWNEPLKWNREAEAAGERRRVFCASMADVFERHAVSDVDDQMREERTRLGRLIEETPWLDWLLLTKRPENVIEMIPAHWTAEFPSNVWLGTTVESQEYTWRIRDLMTHRRRARVLFLSVEPLLGPIDLEPFLQYPPMTEGYKMAFGATEWRGIDWVIVGGESGANAKPMHPEWVRQIRDDVKDSDAAFHFKQWGEWAPGENVERTRGRITVADFSHGRWFSRDEDLSLDYHSDDQPTVYRIGKKAAGRLLDGRTWDEVPA
jgi:protein gp37